MRDKIIEDNNLIEVESLNLGDSYSWSEMEVFYSKELKRFFWIEGSGCSCDYLWEGVRSLADMCDGTRQSAANAVRGFAEEHRSDFYGDIATAANRVLGF